VQAVNIGLARVEGNEELRDIAREEVRVCNSEKDRKSSVERDLDRRVNYKLQGLNSRERVWAERDRDVVNPATRVKKEL
jgi:hypothetical protein